MIRRLNCLEAENEFTQSVSDQNNTTSSRSFQTVKKITCCHHELKISHAEKVFLLCVSSRIYLPESLRIRRLLHSII